MSKPAGEAAMGGQGASFGVRLVVYLVVLTVGVVLGATSAIAHILFTGWLTRAGLLDNVCGNGCPEAWAVTLIGPFAVAVVGAAGLFAGRFGAGRLAVLALLAAAGYAAALRWSIYGVQYAFLAGLFAIAAFVLARAARAAMLRA